jgi:hypothetical protein
MLVFIAGWESIPTVDAGGGVVEDLDGVKYFRRSSLRSSQERR